MKNHLELTLLLALVVAIISALVFAVSPTNDPRVVPRCQEDEVVVGVGDLDDGYWSVYRCVNVEEIR